jgi:hypothetical protein
MLERARRLARLDHRATLEVAAPSAMFERIEREQAKGWRKRQIEDEKEKRCPTCNKLIDDEDVKND